MLQLDSFTLENDTTVFAKDVNASLEPGQILAVVGPSQSGKTFFLHQLKCGKPCTPEQDTKIGFFARRKLRKALPAGVAELIEKRLGLGWSELFSRGTCSRGQAQLRNVVTYTLAAQGNVCLLDTPFLNMDVMTKKKLANLLPELLRLLGKSAVVTSTDNDLEAAAETIHLTPTPKAPA